MKINLSNTIISLTGSNPLHEQAIKYIRNIGILVYLDIDTNIILSRLNKMKVNRIVGQTKNTLPEILEWRKSIYELYYDVRVIIEENETIESIADKIIEILGRDQEFVSTRGRKDHYLFLEVIKEGLAADRGLFVPKYLPSLSLNQISRLINLSYQERY